MTTRARRFSAVAAAAAALTLALAGCGSSGSSNEAAGSGETISVETNLGTVDVPADPKSVVALDNRTFQTLDEWGVELKAGARALMPPTVSYKNNDDVVDIGNHNEPNLEAIVAAQPDLIISGQRFTQHNDKIKELVPDAALVDVSPRDGENLADELKRETTAMGEIFGKQDEAKKLNDDFDASIQRVKDAYNPDQKVMSLITSGGEINFSAPGTGRTLGTVYDVLGFTPALEVADSSSNHEGDDVSVEAIADSNPDWILVMDRDAAVAANRGEQYTPANELLAESEALKNVKAVKEDHIVYMPQYTYINEGIQTYTDFFNSVADAMEK